MPGKTPFRLNRSGLLLALISAAFAGQVQAAAGRVEFAVGPASVVGSDGQVRPAARGLELDTGDTLRTEQNGRVQVRMTDGAYISLQPNTEFGIKDYKFEGKTDGSENALYSLVKGAMRTVTGLIGRINRNKYLVTTPTATVGIRGTGGLIEVLQDGATLVQGTSGIWFLANPAGTIDIPAGVAGIAPVDPKLPPKETLQIPTVGPTPLPLLAGFVQGDQRTLLSGPGYAAVLTFGSTTASVDARGGTAIFDGSGQMTQFEPLLQLPAITQAALVQALPTSSSYTLLAGSTHADFGTDGILAWGRWIGSVSIFDKIESYDGNKGLHYVVGLPTPVMPLTGSATYTLLGATRPTYIDGSTAPGAFSGSLRVTFGAMALIDANFTVAMPDNTYGIGAKGVTTTTAAFSFTAFGTDGTMTGCSSSTCSANVQGFFAGPTAERAGVGYSLSDIDLRASPKEIVGAAAFTKQ